jgi:hypothetical protein
MFEGLIHAGRLHKLHNEKRRIQREYKKKLAELTAADRPPLELDRQLESDRLFFEERMKIQLLDAEILELLSLRLVQIAQRNLLPYPEFKSEGGAWVKSSVAGRWHLTIEAITDLRAAIRRERKERSENWRMWLAALTGLVGSLIGLASLFLKR